MKDPKEEDRKTTTRLAAQQPGAHTRLAREADVNLVKGQNVTLGQRVTGLDTRVGHVETVVGISPNPMKVPRPSSPDARELAITALKAQSESEHEQSQLVGAVIGHTGRLEQQVADLTKVVGELAQLQAEETKLRNENDAAHDQAFVKIASELGIESKLPPKIQNSITPPAMTPPATPPKPVLGQLEQRSKQNQTWNYVIALALLANALRDSGLLKLARAAVSFFFPDHP